MTESDLIQAERDIERADARTAAAIATAAVMRIGQLGPEGGTAFADLVEGFAGDPDVPEWQRGATMVASALMAGGGL